MMSLRSRLFKCRIIISGEALEHSRSDVFFLNNIHKNNFSILIG